jgi:hypothetical protein
MVQLFSDLCRETRTRGALAMVGLWAHILGDLLSSACHEHVLAWKGQAMKTVDLTHKPVLWPQVILSILPGLCATVVTSRVFSSLFDPGMVWIVRLACLATTCDLLAVLALRRRQAAIWSLPALGMLSSIVLVPMPLFAFQTSGPQGRLALMVLTGALLLGAFALQRRRFSAGEWIGLGTVLLLSAALCLFYWLAYPLTDPWAATWPAMVLLQCLIPVTGGAVFASRYGVRACVLVMPALHTTIAAALYSSSLAVSPFTYLVTCCYTVLPVIWVLRARSTSSQIAGLFVPWLAAAGLVLGYNFPNGLIARAVGQALVLSAIALSVLLYYQAYDRQATRNADLPNLATP